MGRKFLRKSGGAQILEENSEKQSHCQNTIKYEPDPEDTNEQMIKNTEHIKDRCQNFIKTENPTDLSYSQTGL